MAVTITPDSAAVASGVSRPSASSAPPPASAAPAAMACRRPGRRPIFSNPSAVAAGSPPNQPNSFWVLCPMNSPPTSTRVAVFPILIRVLLVLAPARSTHAPPDGILDVGRGRRVCTAPSGALVQGPRLAVDRVGQRDPHGAQDRRQHVRGVER